VTSSTPDDLDARLAARARLRWEESTAQALVAVPRDVDPDAIVDGAMARLADEAARVVDLDARRPRAWKGWLGAATAALVAALLVLWLRPAGPVLPGYEASFEGGIKSERGDAANGDRVVLLPSSRIRWSFGPATATDLAVELRIEAHGPTHACLEPGGMRRSDTGAVDVAGPTRDVLDLPAGTWELTALLATADRFAELTDPCARADDGMRPAGVVELDRRTVEIRDAP
jgi:hypothetical protein